MEKTIYCRYFYLFLFTPYKKFSLLVQLGYNKNL